MKVLVTDALDEEALVRLRAAGHEVQVTPGVQGAALIAALDGCAGLLVRGGTRVTAEVLRESKSLRVVVRAGSGLDNVDQAEARKRGVAVFNTPAANAVSVAELVIGALIAFERHIVPAATALRAGRWEKNAYQGRELAGRAIGLLGFGRIAREVARRARAFGMAVHAADPLLSPWPERWEWVHRSSLDAMLPTVDILSLHVPLTADTRGLLGDAELARMKPDALLVNAARGGVVDESALCLALQSRALRGAIVDVFAVEPAPADHPLLAFPNVLALPHLGAQSAEAQRRAGLEAADLMLEALGAG